MKLSLELLACRLKEVILPLYYLIEPIYFGVLALAWRSGNIKAEVEGQRSRSSELKGQSLGLEFKTGGFRLSRP